MARASGAHVNVVLPTEQALAFRESVLKKWHAPIEAISCIDLDEAKATKDDDAKASKAAVQQQPGGISEQNRLLLYECRGWLLDEGLRMVDAVKGAWAGVDCLKVCNEAGEMMQQLEFNERAFSVH